MKTVLLCLFASCLIASAQSPDVLRAMAATNFNARCAADMRWRTLTNQIAQQTLTVKRAQSDYTAATQRAAMERQAKLIKSSSPPYVTSASKALNDAKLSKANMELRKTSIENELRKLQR